MPPLLRACVGRGSLRGPLGTAGEAPGLARRSDGVATAEGGGGETPQFGSLPPPFVINSRQQDGVSYFSNLSLPRVRLEASVISMSRIALIEVRSEFFSLI